MGNNMLNEGLRNEKLKNAYTKYDYIIENVSDYSNVLVEVIELYNILNNTSNVSNAMFAPFSFTISLLGDDEAVCNEHTGMNNIMLSKEQWEQLKNKVDNFYTNHNVQEVLEDLFIQRMNSIVERGVSNGN